MTSNPIPELRAQEMVRFTEALRAADEEEKGRLKARYQLRKELACRLEELYDAAARLAVLAGRVCERIEAERLEYRPNSLGEIQAAGARIDAYCGAVAALQAALKIAEAEA